jgi:hypothetical protein
MSTTRLSVLAVQMPKGLAEHVRRLADENDRTVQAEIRRGAPQPRRLGAGRTRNTPPQTPGRLSDSSLT